MYLLTYLHIYSPIQKLERQGNLRKWSLPGFLTLQSEDNGQWSSPVLANLRKWSLTVFLPFLRSKEIGHHQPNSKPKKMIITSLSKPQKLVITRAFFTLQSKENGHHTSLNKPWKMVTSFCEAQEVVISGPCGFLPLRNEENGHHQPQQTSENGHHQLLRSVGSGHLWTLRSEEGAKDHFQRSVVSAHHFWRSEVNGRLPCQIISIVLVMHISQPRT